MASPRMSMRRAHGRRCGRPHRPNCKITTEWTRRWRLLEKGRGIRVPARGFRWPTTRHHAMATSTRSPRPGDLTMTYHWLGVQDKVKPVPAGRSQPRPCMQMWQQGPPCPTAEVRCACRPTRERLLLDRQDDGSRFCSPRPFGDGTVTVAGQLAAGGRVRIFAMSRGRWAQTFSDDAVKGEVTAGTVAISCDKIDSSIAIGSSCLRQGECSAGCAHRRYYAYV